MDQYRCKLCNYRMKSELAKKLCPNCGERGTLEQEKDADELLDSLDD